MRRTVPYGLFLLLFACGGAYAGTAEPAAPQQPPAAAEQHARRGLAALQASRLSEAESEFLAGLKITPRWPELRADLGLAYYADHKYREAVAAFKQALDEDPSLASAKSFLALSLAAAGRCGDAEPGLRSIFEVTSDARLRRIAGLSLQRCYVESGRSRDADEILQKLLTAFPDDPDVLFEAGQFYAELSSKIDLHLAHVDPHSARTYQLMASAAAAQGNWRAAINAYRQSLKLNPGLEGAHLQIAILLLTHSPDPSAWHEALAELNDELIANPGSAEAEYEIGEIYRKHGELRLAEPHFRKALADDPAAVPARIGLAKALRQLGDTRGALSALLPAEQSTPNDASVHFLLAQIYRALGQSSQANQEQAAFERLQKATSQPAP